MPAAARVGFSTVDLVVFVGFLAGTALLGLSFAVWPLLRKQAQTTGDIMLGNKEMSIIPVALTLVATFVSAISLLGYPAEIYLCGTMFAYYGLMYFIAFPVSALVYLPVFYNLKLTSAYEYFELRFSRLVRLSGSALFCVLVFKYMSVVLYAPALALSVVTTLSLPASILTTGLLATAYTSFGGAKAVVWTNTLQMVIIVAGMVCVVVAGCVSHGGLSNVLAIAEQGHRLDFADFRPDPTVRHSFWSLMIGGTVTLLTLYGANQMTIQRYLSMPTLRKAQVALLLNVPVNLLTISLYLLAGLILYAEYAACDPVKAGLLKKHDELLPYYVMHKLDFGFGLPGLFIAALYSAGLSTLSGGLNAVASVVYVDFIQPLYVSLKGAPPSEAVGTRLLRLVAVVFGLGAIGMAFAFSQLSSSVLQIALSIFGMVGGPLLGIFTLGMTFPWANRHGALAGLWVSFAAAVWLGIGAISHKIGKTKLPLGDSCPLGNVSTFAFPPLPSAYNRVAPPEGGESALDGFYSLSYQYYALFAFLVAYGVGVAVSFLTGAQDPSRLSPKLLIPLYRQLCCCCPGKAKARLRCGVDWEAASVDGEAAELRHNASPAKAPLQPPVKAASDEPEKTPFIDA